MRHRAFEISAQRDRWLALSALIVLPLLMTPTLPHHAAQALACMPGPPPETLPQTTVAPAAAPAAGAVEEVLAAVGRTPILKSDIELAVLLELAPRDQGPDPTSNAESTSGSNRSRDVDDDREYRSRLLDLRINLELEYRDLEQSGVLYRLEADVAGVLEGMIDRAGGREALGPRLEAEGLLWSDVEDLALRVAVTSAYVKERLRPQVTVSLEELDEAYNTLVVARLGIDEDLPPLSAVRDQLYQLLVERKLNREIELWLAHARERLEVTRFAP